MPNDEIFWPSKHEVDKTIEGIEKIEKTSVDDALTGISLETDFKEQRAGVQPKNDYKNYSPEENTIIQKYEDAHARRELVEPVWENLDEFILSAVPEELKTNIKIQIMFLNAGSGQKVINLWNMGITTPDKHPDCSPVKLAAINMRNLKSLVSGDIRLRSIPNTSDLSSAVKVIEGEISELVDMSSKILDFALRFKMYTTSNFRIYLEDLIAIDKLKSIMRQLKEFVPKSINK